MKKIVILFCFFLINNGFAQSDGKLDKSLYIKVNALGLPILIANVGLEYQLAPKYTIQGDVLVSPWKSFSGNHLQAYVGFLEGRYYFKKAFEGLYVGANLGASVFDLTKYNYWNQGKYQRGYNYMIGGVVGYQLKMKENWNLDFFLGGGSSQGFYRGYHDIEGVPNRYENAEGRNRSGEWIPYRGGIMISYKLK